jgi:nucleoside-diphosphate kinase
MMEQTFAMIKPDAVRAKNSGKIIDMIESHGFDILEMKKLSLTEEQAKNFYDIHKNRSFFGELISSIISGPVIAMILKKENAIADWRALMGATNPAEAAPNTVRKLYGANIGENAVHGSDGPETAQQEIKIAKSWL